MALARPILQRQPPQPTEGDQWLSDISAATGATRLAASTGAFGSAGPAVKTALGDVANITGIVSGLEQGGVGGDLAAGANAAQLAAKLGSGTELGSVAAEAVPPLVIASSIYNFAENWQSGKTGSDALSGAEAGAAIGSVIPGVGTAIGAVVGGAIGALSSAFGGGATDPETKNWQSFINATGGANATQAQVSKYQNLPPGAAFNLLAGVMDIKDGRIPIVNVFGRMGESNLLNQMTTQINSAIKSGAVSSTATPQQIYSQVVTPWLNSKGATITPETGGLQLQAVLTSLIGSWQSGSLTSKTILDSGGSSDTALPTYEGITARSSPAAQAASANATSMLSTFGSTKPSSSTLTSAIPTLLTIPGGLGGPTAGAKMADPNNPGATNPTQQQSASPTAGMPYDPGAPFSDMPPSAAPIENMNVQPIPGGGTGDSGTGAPATGGTSTSSGSSDISSLLSSLGTGVSSFLGSPLGSLAEFGTLGALGLSQANAQKATNDQLAGSLTATGQPFTSAAQGELSQLEGGPQVGGPLGASINDQTTAAANLGKIATQYSTGNLTPAQQQQVNDYVSQQKASAIQELSNRGITDPNSDQYKTAMQQIDNNAAELGQSLITQDTQLAQGALSAVQTTYNNLINQTLSEASFGFSTQEAGVMTQIQSDTQLAQSLNGLFAGIAQGVGNAFKGSAGTSGGTGAGAAGASAIPKLGSAVASQPGGGASGGVASSAGGGGYSQGYSGGAADQATIDQNNAGFVSQTDQTIAGDTTSQSAIDQYASSYTPPDITDPTGADIPAYTSDPFTGGDPFGGFGG